MDEFELLLFSVDAGFIRRAVDAGVDAIVVDLETRGKDERQAGVDTEVNRHTVDDLRRVRTATDVPVVCRINGVGPGTEAEVERVVEAGADELLIPMVRDADEVRWVLDRVARRCAVGILVETTAAVEQADELAELPLRRVYVGLNDLRIDRGTPSIFSAVLDGTVERVRACFDVPFGFAGLTLPDRGHPIPCRLLIAEMARLDCAFSLLRRSFHRDVRGRDLATAIPRIAGALARARRRPRDAVARDHRELLDVIGRRCLPEADAVAR